MKTLIKVIREQFDYKNQILEMSKIDFTNTYGKKSIDWFQTILNPILTIFAYWFAFAIALGIGQKTNGFPYFLWLLSGLIPWFYMKVMLVEGTDCIIKYSDWANKMKVPVSIIPTFVNISKFIVHSICIYLLIVIFRLFGYAADIYLLQLPFYMLLTFIFLNIWSLFSSLMTVKNKKYSNFVKSIITVIFWLSAIMWNPKSIKNKLLRKILRLNPITYLVEGYRNCFINKVWFWQSPKTLICFIAITFILGVLVLFIYKKHEKSQ